jgi:hypothetical protein
MKKLLIFLVLVGYTSFNYSQTLIQTFTDRCTGATQVFQIAMTGTTTVVFYGRAQSFTAADVQSGAFQAWLQETYAWWEALNPCSAAQAESQTAQQTAQQTTSAATSAATNATSSSPPTTDTTNTASTNATSNTTDTSSNQTSSTESTNSNTSGSSEQSQNESSSSSSGGETSESSSGGKTTDTESGETQETKTEETSSESDGGSQEENKESESKTEESSEESKEEEVKEEKQEESSEEESKEEESKEEEKEEESKEEEKEEESEEEDSESSDEEEEETKEKKKKSLAPPIVTANMMGNQMLDGTWTTAASFGLSQSSLTGQETYSANAMIWSNLKQFSLGVSKSKVNFWSDKQIFSEVIQATGNRRATQGDPIKQKQIHHVGTVTLNYMNIFGTNVVTGGYSHVILGQNDNFWKGFAGGYAATGSIIILPESTLFSPAFTFFGTKPIAFKSLPRWGFAPMIAVSLSPIQITKQKKELNVIWNEYFNYIIGTNINFKLTQRFVANLGINTINNTNPIIPTTFAITIGARFAF